MVAPRAVRVEQCVHAPTLSGRLRHLHRHRVDLHTDCPRWALRANATRTLHDAADLSSRMRRLQRLCLQRHQPDECMMWGKHECEPILAVVPLCPQPAARARRFAQMHPPLASRGPRRASAIQTRRCRKSAPPRGLCGKIEKDELRLVSFVPPLLCAAALRLHKLVLRNLAKQSSRSCTPEKDASFVCPVKHGLFSYPESACL